MTSRQRNGFFAGSYYLIAVAGRLIPHPANFTPVGASALFGGARLQRPWNYLAPLAVMSLTDLLLGGHKTMIYVYFSLIAAVWIGERLIQNARFGRMIIASVLASTVFFVITNFGVWQSTPMYPHTLAGLVACYTAAIPFWRNALAGDMLFGVAMFYLPVLHEAFAAYCKKLQNTNKGGMYV